MEWETFDPDPERDERWECWRDYWFPSLNDDHPVAEMVWPIFQNSLEVLLPLKARFPSLNDDQDLRLLLYPEGSIFVAEAVVGSPYDVPQG